MCGAGSSGDILYRFDKGAGHVPFPRDLFPGRYQVVRCCKCSMVYLDTRPVEASMSALYRTEGYFDGDSCAGYESYDDQKQTLGRTFVRYLKTLFRMGVSSKNRMADIGCGKGYLLREARPFFKMTAGTDLSKGAVAAAAQSCDVALCGGPDALVSMGLGEFDLITAVSVLEHVYRPVEFMEQCSSLLSDQGVLSVVVPWFGGFWQQVMGRRWSSFILPEHIAYYDRQSLNMLGVKSDLTLMAAVPYAHYFPLSLVLNKLGIKWNSSKSGKTGQCHIFLPGVMINALYKKSASVAQDGQGRAQRAQSLIRNSAE